MERANDSISVLTAALNNSINAFLAGERATDAMSGDVAGFVAYLSGQQTHICQFRSVESDIVKYLETYVFKKKNDFDKVRHICDILPGLEANIEQMGRIAQGFSSRPDRNGLGAILGEFSGFVTYCAENMVAGAVDEALAKSSELLRRMMDVSSAFKREDALFKDISLLLKDNAALLQDYPCYEEELKTFLSEYPHEGSDDMEYVKLRLQDLSIINERFGALKKEINEVSSYADRYNINDIREKAGTIVDQGRKNLKHADLTQVSTLIRKGLKRIEDSKKEFRKEERTLKSLYKKLTDNSIDMWSEDSASMANLIIGIINRGACFVRFSLDDINAEKDSLVRKKLSEIEQVKIQYRWLNRRRYTQPVYNLSRTGISYRKFLNGIEDIKSERSIFTKLYEGIFY